MNIIERAARVLYEDDTGKSADDIDMCDEWQLDQWRSVAATLHNAGLLATHEEWSAAYYGVTAGGARELCIIGTEGSRAHAEAERADCAKDDPSTRFFLVRRGYTEWRAVE